MKYFFEHKGYKGSIEYNNKDSYYYGKIINIKDLVNYEADSIDYLEIAFHAAVEDYIYR